MVKPCYPGGMTDAPPDPLHRVRADLARNGILRLFGAEVAHLQVGEVDLALAFRDEVGQHHGFFHGGVLATLLDVACGMAALSLMTPGQGVVSAEFKVNFLQPAQGPRLLVQGRVVRTGRLLSVCTGSAYVGERHVALMQATMASVPQP